MDFNPNFMKNLENLMNGQEPEQEVQEPDQAEQAESPVPAPAPDKRVILDSTEDAIEMMNAASAGVQQQSVASFDLSEIGTDSETIEEQIQHARTQPAEPASTQETVDPQQIKAISAQLDALSGALDEQMVALNDGIGKLAAEIAALKTAMPRQSGDGAVEALKRSLQLHQNNEDKLYKELDSYRKNQYYNYIKPFLEFLLTLLSDMNGSMRQYEEERESFIEAHGEQVYDEIIRMHQYYTEQILFQLQIQGVEVIEYQPDTSFIATEQMIGKPVLTDKSELVGKVARIDSPCYRYEDKILKKAKVSVYKAAPKPAAEECVQQTIGKNEQCSF